MKKIKEIYNKIYKALKTLYIFNIGNNFKKRKERREYLIAIGDWYYQHSWFERKWFLHKLKRKIMNFVYKFTDKINDEYFDFICEKYFTHYKFATDDNKIIAELPLIIYCRNVEEYVFIVGELNRELSRVLLYKIFEIPKYELITNINIQNKINELEFKYSEKESAIVKIITRTENELNTFDYINSQNVDLTIVKTNGNEKYIEPNSEFRIYIMDRK